MFGIAPRKAFMPYARLLFLFKRAAVFAHGAVP